MTNTTYYAVADIDMLLGSVVSWIFVKFPPCCSKLSRCHLPCHHPIWAPVQVLTAPFISNCSYMLWKSLGPCHSQGRHEENFRLLTSAWPSPSCGCLRSEQAGRKNLFFSLSPSYPVFQINQSRKQVLKWKVVKILVRFSKNIQDMAF